MRTILGATIALLLCGSANADKLDDFREAVSKNGRDSIPYSDLRSTCRSQQRKDIVEGTIETIDKCVDYRRAVMNVFAYATDKVRGESEPDIKPYAQQLRDKYPRAISGHQEAIDGKSNARETCKKELP